jgi:hypothetical protein
MDWVCASQAAINWSWCSVSYSVGVSIPRAEWRRLRLWKTSRYSKMALASSRRLNRGGDRQLNRALHTIVLSRLTHHQKTRDYAHRRATEGKTTREIKRCLKRYLARQLYRQLQTNPRLTPIPANSET